MNINPDSAKDIPCKNVLIYGYCKYENKGCAFSHPLSLAAASKASTVKTTLGASSGSEEEPKRRFNMNTPSFLPAVGALTNKFSALSPKLKEIPVFVPSGMDPEEDGPPAAVTPQAAPGDLAPRKFNAATPSFTPANPMDMLPAPTAKNPYLGQNGPAEDYMYHHSLGTQAYPLHHHLYAPAPPPRLAVPLDPHETNVHDMFIANDVRELLTKKNEATLQTMPHLLLPDHVGVYHLLVPIDLTFDQLSKAYLLPCHVYKASSSVSGLPYVVRRLDHALRGPIASELPFRTVKRWRSIKNPNVVHLEDAFTSVAFSAHGEPSLCLVYDYYPLADTLLQRHVTRRLATTLQPVSEDLLWLYLVQLTGALLDIHAVGLNAGSSVSTSKILVTNKSRVRLGAVCVDDILEYDAIEHMRADLGAEATISKLQLADVTRLGAVMLELVASTLPSSLRSGSIDDILALSARGSVLPFSADFLNTVRALTEAEPGFSLAAFYTRYLAQRALRVLNGLQDLTDYYEGQLLSELENGRLFRLMAKLNYLLDRPEQDGDLRGNLYVINLFREFVFQTTDDTGKPVVDLSRVLVNLNKLDVGVDEKILLVSREEDSCLMVSYKEIKDVLDQTFRSVFR